MERKSVGVVAGRGVGKGDAIRKKEMVQASKRRKLEGDKPAAAQPRAAVDTED